MNSMSAEYLFQQDKNYDVSYDTGDKSLQCGRHNDIFKFWLTWRSKGRQGFAEKIENLFDVAEFTMKEIKSRSSNNFILVLPVVECLNVSFWYVPDCIRRHNLEMENWSKKPYNCDPSLLDRVAPVIKSRLMERGKTMVGYQPLEDMPNFFRIIISNSATINDDVKVLLDEIDSIGKELTMKDLNNANVQVRNGCCFPKK